MGPEDHLVYIPILALIGLFVAGVEQAGNQWPSKFSPIGIALITLAVAALGLQAFAYSTLFTDKERLWRYNLSYYPDLWITRYTLGISLGNRGELDEAIKQLRESVRINPDFGNAQLRLGCFLCTEGKLSEGMDAFRTAIHLNPHADIARYFLSNALVQTGRYPEAIAQLDVYVAHQPDSVEGHDARAIALSKAGRMPEAITELEVALRLDPGNVNIRRELELMQATPAKETRAK